MKTENRQNENLTNVPWNVRDALVVFILAWIGLPIGIILVLSQLAHALPALRPLFQAFKDGSIEASFALAVVNAGAAFGLVLYYLRHHGANLRDLGLRRFSIGQALRYLVITVVAFMVLVPLAFYAVSILFPAFNASQEQVNDFTRPTSPQSRHLSFIALVLLPPLVEEMVFRGFMFPAFAKRLGPIWGAVMTSLLFGLAHLQFNVGIYTVLLGLLLCWLYYKTRSLIPGICLHILNNYVAFVVLTGK